MLILREYVYLFLWTQCMLFASVQQNGKNPRETCTVDKINLMIIAKKAAYVA